ncbi:hypothetical protein L3Q82_007140 [Scortum barcoo]|uniref:Uncharacterized protein n=1 Tax=Scortum barcoo TaxID=214431 RepID=A0ACB8WS61_9TELE|nr:hypothetical protein L3Q82_007140 [Scortum barcoo]
MIRDSEVECVSSFKFLGIHICDDLTWTLNITQLVKKAHQRLYFLRRLRKFGMSQRTQRTFYTAVIESILTSCITVWYGNSTAADCKRLQRAVRLAERIVQGTAAPVCRTSTTAESTGEPAASSETPPPPAHTLQSSALWQEVQECEEQDLQAEGQFLSTSHKTHQQMQSTTPAPP